MTTRIKLSDVESRVATVNRLLGFDPERVTYNTVGAIMLDGAYGAYAVHMASSRSGGTTEVFGRTTLREVDTFLRGVITGLTIEGQSRNAIRKDEA